MIGDELRSSSKAARSKQERQQVSAALHARVHLHFGTAEPNAEGAVPAVPAEAVSESDMDEPAAGTEGWAGQQATYSEVKVALKVRHLLPTCGQCILHGPGVWSRTTIRSCCKDARMAGHGVHQTAHKVKHLSCCKATEIAAHGDQTAHKVTNLRHCTLACNWGHVVGIAFITSMTDGELMCDSCALSSAQVHKELAALLAPLLALPGLDTCRALRLICTADGIFDSAF